MLRRWWVRPDQILETDGVELETVSRELSIKAFVDAEAHLAHFGGTLNIVAARQPTGLPGEHVTTAIMFEYRDAPVTKERPEVPSVMEAPPSMPDQPVAEPTVEAAQAIEVDVDPQVVEMEPEPEGPAVPDVLVDDDGAPEEDVSSIPRARRAKAVA